MTRRKVPTFEDLDRALAVLGERLAAVALNYPDDYQMPRLAEAVAVIRRVLLRLEESVARRCGDAR